MALLTMLNALYDTEDDKLRWLRTQQRLFQDRRPLELIETNAGLKEVCTVFQAALDGAYI